MELRSLFYRWMNEYGAVLSEVKANTDFKNPFRELIAKEIPGALQDAAGIQKPYIVTGSYGRGRWTDVPWVAVFDERITTSAQKGVYIVYLLNKDTKTLYLTLNQGAIDAAQRKDGGEEQTGTTFISIARSQDEKMTERLMKQAAILREKLQIPASDCEEIHSGSPGYDAGCICAKAYTLDALPADRELLFDLGVFMERYGAYYDLMGEKPAAPDQTSSGGETHMTTKEQLAAVKAYIAARGFHYEGDLIENFYLSLKSKPFVILAGTSGTGKTRLVKLFAEAIGAKMKLVPVRPDWSDSSDLFGHTDLSNRFHPGAILEFIKQAEWDKQTPYFLCLDEMNLARVEYYLSDVLSIIETRDRRENGEIETDPLVDASYYKDPEARDKYGRVYLPENLYIIGTVNMDETTFPFSKKVLDRANTIEFSFVNLMAKAARGPVPGPQKLDNRFLKTEYLYLRDCGESEVVDEMCFRLEELNQILVKANLHVGYRVRDEISFYMMNNHAAGLLQEDAAFDHQIMQKILPRIQGSSAAIREVLSELFVKCAGDYTAFTGAAAYQQMTACLQSKPCRYPGSARKIAFMMRRYEEDGFTSYWL